jgi:uncharacterized membrane protein YqaE (UPF0057 family)
MSDGSITNKRIFSEFFIEEQLRVKVCYCIPTNIAVLTINRILTQVQLIIHPGVGFWLDREDSDRSFVLNLILTPFRYHPTVCQV